MKCFTGEVFTAKGWIEKNSFLPLLHLEQGTLNVQHNTQEPSSEGKVNDMRASNILFKLVLKSTIRQSYSDIK